MVKYYWTPFHLRMWKIKSNDDDYKWWVKYWKEVTLTIDLRFSWQWKYQLCSSGLRQHSLVGGYLHFNIKSDVHWLITAAMYHYHRLHRINSCCHFTSSKSYRTNDGTWMLKLLRSSHFQALLQLTKAWVLNEVTQRNQNSFLFVLLPSADLHTLWGDWCLS